MFLKRWWATLGGWCARTWADLRPGEEARGGALWASVVVAVIAAVVGGLDLHSGFGLAVDLIFALLVAAIGIPLFALIWVLLLKLLRPLSRIQTGVALGAGVFVSLVLPPSGLVFVPLAALFGAALATLVRGHFAQAHLSKKILTVVLGLASIGTLATLLVILARDGDDEDLVKPQQATASLEPVPLAAPDPSARGPLPPRRLAPGTGAGGGPRRCAGPARRTARAGE